ncbi:lactation elevated protein 1 [Podospora australis]|uniref:Lactation elevated protein 1 n=1 Tax=Podospora australis TaxID=1536484 RepID=A0AAN7ALH5_9PEZI|nr:lactation elevated protein 1 [Podospora australis]
MNRAATSVTITDPFVKYTSLIATGVYSPDAAQYRLAHHLQKVYSRLKDYTPSHEYRSRLQQIAKIVGPSRTESGEGLEGLAAPAHPIRRNPLFTRFFQNDEAKDSLALTKTLTSAQAALHADSPKGLFLSGEVGTGKSMLLDLLSEGLPTPRKKRWHFNTFMLHAFSRLEEFRRSDPATRLSSHGAEYSLLWIAKEMVEQSPILFLDEFQLPDRAASKIMNHLFIAFFQLGGVLVASSNRMPEELEKATAGYYSPPTTGGLVERVLGLGKSRYGELFGQTSDFASFLEVLKARCDFWHMEGTRDWRRRETDSRFSQSTPAVDNYTWPAGSTVKPVQEQPESNLTKPAMYHLPSDGDEKWSALQSQLGKFEPASLVVYGRKVAIPKQRAGVTYWDFDELVSSLGPADYISLASNYHTFIIDNVPVLTMSLKNEARRFITLLDALYESRCKLMIRAEVGPDDLFFPETRQRSTSQGDSQSSSTQDDNTDATYSETIAEVFQDQMSPFRPNISTYTDSPNAKYDPDQDSDFGKEQDAKVDFSKTGGFIGEDERFAYKRATSRLWELCSKQWHAREGSWWQPLTSSARHWEGSKPSSPAPSQLKNPKKNGRLRLITFTVGLSLTVFCIIFLFRTPPSSGTRNQHPESLLENLSLNEDQCRAAFPGLTKEIDDTVAEGPFVVKQTGERGPVQARIKDGKLSIIHAARRVDLSQEMLNSRTASLHQIHRAILTSPSALPDTIFSLNFQDQPYGTAFTYSRAASAALRSKDPNARNFLMPHFSFWAWNLPFIGSISRAHSAISSLESSLSFQQKIPKAVWRGTSWFNSVTSPRLRQNLILQTKNQPWADVESLNWTGSGGPNQQKNATNALATEDFCRYKYIVHTEGIAYSGRFQFLQMCNSVVLTPPIQWLQHTTHMVKPLFSNTLTLKGEEEKKLKWEPSKQMAAAWPVRYKPEEANIVFVKPDWQDLGATIAWLEENPDVAEGIARRQRDLFVGGGYFSPAAETCYWRALIRGWAKVAKTEGQGWEETEGVTFEQFALGNSK